MSEKVVRKSDKEFYKEIAEINDVQAKDVRGMFIWYDLLSYLLPFQLIFILVFTLGGRYYSLTMISLFFILICDSLISASLKRDGKNYVKFQKNLSLVKLWVVPLAVMAIVTTVCLLAVTFGTL